MRWQLRLRMQQIELTIVDNKYIMVEDEFGNEVPILFGPSIQHWIPARPYEGCVLSAGFYRVTDGKVEVFGKSDSLKLGTREIDARFIARLVAPAHKGQR